MMTKSTLILLLNVATLASSFTPNAAWNQVPQQHSADNKQLMTQLLAEKGEYGNKFFNGLFDGIGKQLFGDNDGDKSDNGGNMNTKIIAPGDQNRVFEIPAKSMKPGGLKLFLSLHLMGQQNTPNKGSWKVLSTDDGNVDMIFHDESAGLLVRFLDDKIAVDRWGNTPSLQYLIQESVILNGFLDELQAISLEGDVKEEDRLFVVREESSGAIEQARNAISFS